MLGNRVIRLLGVGIFVVVLSGCSVSFNPGPDEEGICYSTEWAKDAQRELIRVVPKGASIVDSGPSDTGCGYPDNPVVVFRMNSSPAAVVDAVVDRARQVGWELVEKPDCLRKTISDKAASLYMPFPSDGGKEGRAEYVVAVSQNTYCLTAS